MTIGEICKAYHVGKTAVFKLLKQERETGDITTKTHLCGRKLGMDAAEIMKLKELIDTHPDMTLEEIKTKMGLPISVVAIHNTIHKKLNYTDMTRRYARAYKGTRAHGSAPLNKPTSTTIRSSIRVDRTTVPLIFSGALSREKFKEYLRDYLLPPYSPVLTPLS